MRFGWPGGRNHWLLGREVLSAWWGTWQLLSRGGGPRRWQLKRNRRQVEPLLGNVGWGYRRLAVDQQRPLSAVHQGCPPLPRVAPILHATTRLPADQLGSVSVG